MSYPVFCVLQNPRTPSVPEDVWHGSDGRAQSGAAVFFAITLDVL